MNASNPFPTPVDIRGYQAVSGSCSDQDYVQVAWGNLGRQVTLVNVPTNGLALSFQLNYNSIPGSTALGPVGYYWTHPYMAKLMGVGTDVISAVMETGRQYDFIDNGLGIYFLDPTTSLFMAATISSPSSGVWRVSLYPDGGYYEFDDSGVLQTIADSSGNTLAMGYTDGLLTSVTESGGARQLVFAYTGSLVTSVTDPNENVTTLEYDSNDNLTHIIGPSGCALSYGYANSENNHLLTSRTDPNDNTYSYTYTAVSESGAQIAQIKDAESPPNIIAYNYFSGEEVTGSVGFTPLFFEISVTTITDPLGKVWIHHFDRAGNLWRTIDPEGHWRRNYWSAEQKLLYTNGGYPQLEPVQYGTTGGPRDNTNNQFWRYAYNSLGMQTMAVGPTGIMDHFIFDNNDRLVSSYSAQSHLGVRGNWIGQYGQDGYLLCAINSDGSDQISLPPYISSCTPTGVTPANYNNPVVLADSRALLVSEASEERGVGLWYNLGSTSSPGSFSIAVETAVPTSFNLSLYSHALDQTYEGGEGYGPYWTLAPLSYAEQFGCYLQYQVTDANGTKNFEVYNNASGIWTTFPVTTTTEMPSVTVVVNAIYNPDSSGSGTVQAQIAALAFDPYQSRETSYTYNSAGLVTSVTDPQNNIWSMTYNTDGTLATSTDPLTNETQYFYEDIAKNLTRIVDPDGQTWSMTYDNNSNLLTLENPNGHTTTMTYDSKNRLLTSTDALGNETQLSYDGAGNILATTDALGRVTQFAYTPTNRIKTITDALLGQTKFTYDGVGQTLSVGDPLSNRAEFTYDGAGRLIQVTQPDTQLVKLAFDAVDRLRAITSPNGTQANPSNINTLNAINLVRNSSVEITDPNDSTQNLGQFWLSDAGSSNRDNTHSHSGNWSLPANTSAGGSVHWYQNQLYLPSGGSYLANLWVEKLADSVPARVSLAVELYKLDLSVQNLSSPPTDLSGSSMTWQQLTSPFQFDVPGDGQYSRYSATQLQATVLNTGSGSEDTSAWLDDFSLIPVSTTYSYDGLNNPQEVRTPNGGRWRAGRDRFGRVSLTDDPRGLQTLLTYDNLDRILSVADPSGNETLFAYDGNSNLISFTDANSNLTHYAFNSRSLLATVTYPDSTTEQFSYDPAANLLTYTDNEGRTRTFYYDEAERLTQVAYSDTTSIYFSYDQASNVLSRTERNGDVTSYTYDALNRVVAEVRTPATGSTDPAWAHSQAFDANGNRIQFNNTSLAVYGTAIYGTDLYATPPNWEVVAPYDSMNRILGYQDEFSHQVRFQYDVEGRRTQISYPFGSPPVTTTAAYDIIGQLLGLNTVMGPSDILALSYGYDRASNRVGLVAGSDTFDYDLDDSNRLTSVCLNRFVERLAIHFSTGAFSGTVLDPSTPGVTLLSISDDFAGTSLNTSRWRLGYSSYSAPPLADFLGLSAEQNGGLTVAFPRGYSDTSLVEAFSGKPDPYGLDTSDVLAGVELRTTFTGDLDFQVDINNFQAYPLGGCLYNVFLQVSDSPFDWYGAGSQVNVGMQNWEDSGGQAYVAQCTGQATVQVSTGDTSGSVRLHYDSSTGEFTLSYLVSGDWTVITSYVWAAGVPLYLSLRHRWTGACGTSSLANFLVNTPTTQYLSSGTYTSGIYDCGRSPMWGALEWTATTPTGTSLKFQVAASDSASGPWTFVGPDGTSASYFTTSGTAIPDTVVGQYLQYQCTLSGDGTATPELLTATVTFAGDNTSSLSVYSYDGAGNLLNESVSTASGTATSVRTVNDLNQIVTNAVTPAGGSTTDFTLSYNDDGTLASKSDGTNTWAYTWSSDGDQRLISMSYNGETQVAFSYDYLGRMLTRTPYTGGVAQPRTSFEWDGWSVCREFTPSGVYRYYAPLGELLTFDYTPTDGETSTFSVHSDALKSVRAITDSTGAVVAHYEYTAWGELLPSSSPLSIRFNYLFVGSLGVRWDQTLGLYYMRQRWMDPLTQRFISRDALRSLNRYVYCANSPLHFVDPSGLTLAIAGPVAAQNALLAYIESQSGLVLSLNKDTGFYDIALEKQGQYNQNIKQLIQKNNK